MYLDGFLVKSTKVKIEAIDFESSIDPEKVFLHHVPIQHLRISIKEQKAVWVYQLQWGQVRWCARQNRIYMLWIFCDVEKYEFDKTIQLGGLGKFSDSSKI